MSVKETPDLVLGVDPGFFGAMAVYSVSEKKILDILDMPLIERRGKRHVDLKAVGFWLSLWESRIKIAIVEEVSSMPGNGSSSSFRFGYYAGALQGILQARGVPVFMIKPAVWKAMMSLSQDKDLSRKRASELMPEDSTRWGRKKDDGRAEAALLAILGEKWTLA